MRTYPASRGSPASRIVREKERETAGGGLANYQGKEDGWGAGGWSGGVKGTGDFAPKSLYLNVIFVIFSFSGPDPVATGDKEPETHLPRKGFAKHSKP